MSRSIYKRASLSISSYVHITRQHHMSLNKVSKHLVCSHLMSQNKASISVDIVCSHHVSTLHVAQQSEHLCRYRMFTSHVNIMTRRSIKSAIIFVDTVYVHITCRTTKWASLSMSCVHITCQQYISPSKASISVDIACSHHMSTVNITCRATSQPSKRARHPRAFASCALRGRCSAWPLCSPEVSSGSRASAGASFAISNVTRESKRASVATSHVNITCHATKYAGIFGNVASSTSHLGQQGKRASLSILVSTSHVTQQSKRASLTTVVVGKHLWQHDMSTSPVTQQSMQRDVWKESWHGRGSPKRPQKSWHETETGQIVLRTLAPLAVYWVPLCRDIYAQ